MLPLDSALTFAISLLAAGTLTGVLARRKARACVLFSLYLGSAAVGPLAIAVWPGMFWNWEFLAAGNTLQATLRLGIVFEIARRSLHPYPRARSRIEMLLALLTLALVPFVALAPRQVGDAFDLAQAVERVSYGAGALFLTYAAALRYYGIPSDPFQRAIVTGFGVEAVLVGCASLLWRFDPTFGLGRDFVVKTAYPCILTFWLVSAWRQDDFHGLSPETLRRIHPWRLR